ncbi:MOSC domain-containing protein [Paraglaciecola aquimarina]|uniref:MOSC domain-containing protein n=1 Tax=Paraglaciecola algarum TaxID=3050085 RepID=A0ABS9DAM7_9ALTE|nr:MOSC domain-containing protein [Paraglaciecola sp. G1-23]MCF2950000.1 MOSC domain-containing protein [Paraglaciecola sp. G1-23]
MQLLGIATREKTGAPMQTHFSCHITKQSGLVPDGRGKPGKRQVTVLSKEQWLQACDELNTVLPWTIRRANLFVEGIRFSQDDVGKHIQIGSLKLLITRETDPCAKMDAQHQGLTTALTPDWRGGVCCKVIEDGEIKLGDQVELIIQP